MTHSLLFDETIELIDPDGIVSGGSYWFEALAGTSWGNPQPVEVILNSLMRDGMLTETESVGNREVNVALRICASDPLGLQDGMDVLHRAVGKRTTLVWTPPDGYADTRVYEVETSSIETGDGDWDLEYLRNEVRVRLRLVCQPYWRETEVTTEVAEGIPSIGTIVNAGTSTTGWSAPTATVPGSAYGTQIPANPQPANMVAVDAGAVAVKAYQIDNAKYVGYLGGTDARPVWNKATLAQNISLASGAYLSFEVGFDVAVGATITNDFGETYREFGALDTFTLRTASSSRTYKKAREAYSDPYVLSDAIVQALGDGFIRYTLRLDQAMAVTSLEWTGKQLAPFVDDAAATERPRIKVRNVAVAETATLGQQVLKTITVGGSARTIGAIHVAAPADNVALGQVLAYTVPASKVATGFRPDLRQWATSYGPVVDGREPIAGGVLEMPASLFESGAYTVVVDQYAVEVGDPALSLTTSIVMAGQAISSEQSSLSWRIAHGQQNSWRMFSAGTVYLPPAAIHTPSADTLVRLQFTASLAHLYNIYVLPTEGDLTIIDCGTGAVGPAASSHLWIASPSPEQPQGGYWRGSTPTRQNAVAAWSTTTVPGIHTFDAAQMLAFVVSTAAQGPTVSFDYHKRRP